MTALNWEKDRAKRHAKERSFDDLPPAGSFQDQRRCGVHPWPGAGRNRHAAGTSQVQVRDRCDDFDQLNRYLQHALHPDFRRKAVCQKAEIIQIVRKLIVRCEAWGAGIPVREKALLDAARNAVRNLSH